MKSELTATVELTVEDVKQAIADYIHHNFDYDNVDLQNVHLHVGTRSMGYGFGECDETYFEKATVKIVLESK